MTILVAGATGTTGSAVVRRLLDRGQTVRALTRSPESATRLSSEGVEPVVVTGLDDADAISRAADGATAAYIATTSSPDLPRLEAAFARTVAAAGVPLVKLSVVGAAADSPVRFARGHAESERAIEEAYRDSGSWTFLQPNGFMQNDLAWGQQIPSGTVAVPGLDSAWSIVDVADIADVAAAVLTDPSAHAGRRIVVTGPESLSPRDRIATVSRVLGRDLTAVDVPLPAFADSLRGYGMDDWYVEALVELMEVYATGAAAGVSPAPEEVLGRPARTWDEFVEEHRDVLAG